MSIAIPGALVIVTFLLTVMLTFSAVLGTTTTQGTSLQEAADVRVAQVAGELSIISTSTGDVGKARRNNRIRRHIHHRYGRKCRGDIVQQWRHIEGRRPDQVQ